MDTYGRGEVASVTDGPRGAQSYGFNIMGIHRAPLVSFLV
jgi:hypothetical protein